MFSTLVSSTAPADGAHSERSIFNMASRKFFAERTDQSEVKARIVEKYFHAWSNVIMPSAREGKIAYIDLYAGPGRYEDGAASTPLLVLEKAIAHPKMSLMLVALFNDADKNLTDTLEDEINKLVARVTHSEG